MGLLNMSSLLVCIASSRRPNWPSLCDQFLFVQVAERALFLWNNDHIENLMKQNRRVILPIIFPALEKNARNHWNEAVQRLSLNVRKIFSDVDPELFEECVLNYEEDKAQEEETKTRREATWERLEDIAGMTSRTKTPSGCLSFWQWKQRYFLDFVEVEWKQMIAAYTECI